MVLITLREAFKNCNKLVEICNLSQTSISNTNNVIKNIYSNPSDKKTFEYNDFVFYNDNGKYMLCGYIGYDAKISLPKSIYDKQYSIHPYAFRNMNLLAEVVIPNNITTLVDNMFVDCQNLKSVYLSKELKEINYGLFENCLNLELIQIPENVTIINQFAFSGCLNLKSITIHKNITYISMGAFNQCESFKEVNYIGTEEDWKNLKIETMSIGGNNLPFFNAIVNYNFEIDC